MTNVHEDLCGDLGSMSTVSTLHAEDGEVGDGDTLGFARIMTAYKAQKGTPSMHTQPKIGMEGIASGVERITPH